MSRTAVISLVVLALSSAPTWAQTADDVPEAPSVESPIDVEPPELPPELSLHEFVFGVLRYTAYHELGHALTSLMALPVPGSEEDAVDDFAFGRTHADEMVATAEYWRLIHDESTGDTRPQAEMRQAAAVHGAPLKRAARAICHLYGTDRLDWRTEQRFKLTLGDGVYISAVLGDCAYSGAASIAGWDRLISSARHTRSWERVEPRVEYRAATEKFVDAKAYLEATRLLEELKDVLADYKVPRDSKSVTLVAKQCGTPNAFWSAYRNADQDIPARSLVLCYEDVADIFDRGRSLGLS